MKRYFLLLFMMVTAMLLPLHAVEAASFSERAANMGEITGIRISTSGDKTRIVVDCDKEVNYETKVMSNPQRVVVDLYGAWLSPKVSKSYAIDSRFVNKVRVAQFDSNTVRVVVESNMGKNNYDVFSLEGGSTAYRVVMDFGNIGQKSTGSTIDFGGKASENKKNQSETKKTEVKKPEKIEQTKPNTEVKKDNKEADKPARKEINVNLTKGIAGKKICIDAGHGGSDVGAIGPTGVTEKSITIRVAKLVQEMLEKEGAHVIMTRTKDVEVSSKGADASDIEELQARCDVANNAGADIFMSFHMDSFTNSTPSGTTGYYYSAGSTESQLLAKYLSEGTIKELGTSSRGVKPCTFYVVKHTDMPATLLEIAFVSNDKEEKLLNSEAGVKKAATGIVNGIRAFFDSH